MDVDPAAWAAAVSTVMASIFAFFKWLLPFLREWDQRRRDRQTLTGFSRYQQLYSALNAIEDAGVPRSIVFAGHNSGGIPKPGSPFYVSALHWNIAGGDSSTPTKYTHLPVDTGYVSMLVEAMNNGSTRFTTADMPPCQLKDIYSAEGVSDSLVVYLGTRDKKLYYMSAAVLEGELTDDQATEIRLQANVIRNILAA